MTLIKREDAIEELCTMMVDCFNADEEVVDAIKTTMNEISSAEPRGNFISREDAIEAIKKEIQDFEANYMHGEDDEEYGHDIGFVAGLHRAKTFIRSLPSADTVSREFYNDAVKANIRLVMENGKLKEQIESAEAEQGEWVRKTKEYNDCDGHRVVHWYECSVCGARPPKDTWKNEWHSNFCPSCGARMYREDGEA